MAGAWRSLRYDMGRRPPEPPADGPDVTSTGMTTFGGASWDFGPEPTEMPIAGRMPKPRRSPRRALAVSTFGLLTVVGAAGSYLVVVNGLVPMRDEKPAAAATVPPPTRATATAYAGIGPSRRAPRALRTSTTEPAPPALAPEPAAREAAAPLPPPRKASPIRTGGPASPACCRPPVPTPTAPRSSPSPTASAPASPSPSASDTGTPSDDPSESPEPRKSHDFDHHRRSH